MAGQPRTWHTTISADIAAITADPPILEFSLTGTLLPVAPATAQKLRKRKRPPERPVVPKTLWGFCIALPVGCARTGGRRRVDARFTLALRTLAFGPFAVWTSVPSDAVTCGIGRFRHASLLARDGARTRSINRTIQRPTRPPVPPPIKAAPQHCFGRHST
jgi:hypothetical protein